MGSSSAELNGDKSNSMALRTPNPPVAGGSDQDDVNDSGASSSSDPLTPTSEGGTPLTPGYEMRAFYANDKKLCSRAVQRECTSSDRPQDHVVLNQILNILLDPNRPISDAHLIEWCQSLIAGGEDIKGFTDRVKEYDNAESCGLVWTANFVAYRCRTCGISPCMSLCAECFLKGNHTGHDFNMFKSQAGGACDCGDSSVMKESGFCSSHYPGASDRKPKAPYHLLAVGKHILPRLLHRLVIQLRTNSHEALKDSDAFITNVLTAMTEMGASMRSVMTKSLIDEEVYTNSVCCNDVEVIDLLNERTLKYSATKLRLESFPPQPNFHQNCTICANNPNATKLQQKINKAFEPFLTHHSFAEELLFWTIVYQFPQKLVCFLLNMLPDNSYKAHFAEAFVHHYSRVSIMLTKFRSDDEGPSSHSQQRPTPHDLLSNCVVHVSVQLYSNEPLAVRLCREEHLLHVMVASLRAMIEGVPGKDDLLGTLTQSTLQSVTRNRHKVVRCDHYILRRHSYWPLVSDLNNILTHLPIAMIFLKDTSLLESWMDFITNFQGMNLNTREMDEHVEYENESYYAAFSAELEICATPLWTLIAHLKNADTASLTQELLSVCGNSIVKWAQSIGFDASDTPNGFQSTFHIPLHRYYSLFLHHGVETQGMSLPLLLPESDEVLKLLIAHPLHVLVSFYEILCGLWVRNGLQMKGQAMTYIQCHFCSSMIDADLFLLQQCGSKINSDWFIQTVLDRFHVSDWLSMRYTNDRPFYARRGFLSGDQIMPMLEGALTFLATLFATRTNLGMDDEEITRQEMVTLLSISDRTHSQLYEMLPDKCGTTSHNRYFDSILQGIADYKEPSLEHGGNLSQGTYFPKHDIWMDEFDPLHVLLRAVHRRDYQSSIDRFTSFLKQQGKVTCTPWPPFRLPKKQVTSSFLDPQRMLFSKVLHGTLFSIIYKAVYVCEVSDQILSLVIYLLEMALNYPTPHADSPIEIVEQTLAPLIVRDGKFAEWFNSDSLLINFNTVIQQVSVPALTCFSLVNPGGRSSMDPGSVEDMNVVFSPFDDDSLTNDDDSDEDQDMIESGPIQHRLPSITLPLMLQDTNTPSTSRGFHIHPTSPSSLSSPTSSALVPVAPDSSPPEIPLPSTSSASIGFNVPAIAGPSSSPMGPSSGMVMHALPKSSRFLRTGEPDVSHSAPAGTGFPHEMKALPASSSTMNLTDPTHDVNESFISLLLRLHAKMSNENDSYRVGPVTDGRIGDGCFFIQRLLNTYCRMNPSNGEKVVNGWRHRIWPRQASEPMEGVDDERTAEETGRNRRNELEERRRKAKERQQKLLGEFAARQKEFLKKMESSQESEGGKKKQEGIIGGDVDGDMNDSVDSTFNPGSPSSGQGSSNTSSSSMGASFIQPELYECVICNQTTPSTRDKLVGMVALLQSTSVLSHGIPVNHLSQLDEEFNILPCEPVLCPKRSTYGFHITSLVEELNKNFTPSSWLNSLSIGWEGGVHVQSCGHFLHVDCHKLYLNSLRSQNPTRQGYEEGEFSCPLCRQMANSVLPVNPDPPTMYPADDVSKDQDFMAVNRDILQLLTKPETPEKPLIKLLANFMEDLTKATASQYRSLQTNPSTMSLFLFLSSIVRTNLECDVLVKVSKSHPIGAKKPCFTPLFKNLALNAKVFITQSYHELWTQLTGMAEMVDLGLSLTQMEISVPLLLKDTTSLLIQVLFSLPLSLDQSYFRAVVQSLFNLTFVQAVSQVTCLMPPELRDDFKAMYHNTVSFSGVDSFLHSLPSCVGMMIGLLEPSTLYNNMKGSPELTSSPQVEAIIRSLCLPFMRTSSILQFHLYGTEYPATMCEFNSPEEMNRLLKNLHLGHNRDSRSGISLLDAMDFVTPIPSNMVQLWASEFNSLALKTLPVADMLLTSRPLGVKRPQLMRLPRMYDQLFLFYYHKVCPTCNKEPKDPAICLVCGTMVCLREPCCRSYSHMMEGVAHAETCGAGTTVYVAINSTTIIVIRGKRACVWGSVYLDSHGEEDRDLKRGKPLYLSQQRFWYLEQQWLTHSFDHTSKRWVWHKNNL